MVMTNYITLTPGVPTRLHFSRYEQRVITRTDPQTGRDGQVNALRFDVDEIDGRSVVAIYSTLSDKHKADFLPYLEGDRYRRYDFIVTVDGVGFRREYQVTPVLRSSA